MSRWTGFDSHLQRASVKNQRAILIAEDNAADVRLMREALQTLDPPPEIHVARDGEEAINFLSRSAQAADAPRPKLVFLDFHLPKTDPREVLQYVKKSEELKNVAVVVLTTSNTIELIREVYQLGADCYLSKPSDLDTFLNTICGAANFWLNRPDMN
jgi:chemotaxis family two-component system response regulator Rcp1